MDSMGDKTLHDLAVEAVETSMQLYSLVSVVAEQVGSETLADAADNIFDAAVYAARLSIVVDRIGLGDVPHEHDEALFASDMAGLYQTINAEMDRRIGELGGEDE